MGFWRRNSAGCSTVEEKGDGGGRVEEKYDIRNMKIRWYKEGKSGLAAMCNKQTVAIMIALVSNVETVWKAHSPHKGSDSDSMVAHSS